MDMLWVCPVCAMGPPQNASNVRRICYGSAMRVKRMCNVCPMDVRWMRLGWVHYGCASIVSWMWHVMCYACVCDGGATGVPWTCHGCTMCVPWVRHGHQVRLNSPRLGLVGLGWLDIPIMLDCCGSRSKTYRCKTCGNRGCGRTAGTWSAHIRSESNFMHDCSFLFIYVYTCFQVGSATEFRVPHMTAPGPIQWTKNPALGPIPKLFAPPTAPMPTETASDARSAEPKLW